MSDMTAREREEARSSEFRPALIAAFGLVAMVGIIATLFVMNGLFKFVSEDEMYSKVLSRPNADLEALRASEHDTLTTYKALDPAKGVYRIPIDRAMQLVVSDYAKRPSAAAAPSTLSPQLPSASPATPEEGKTQ